MYHFKLYDNSYLGVDTPNKTIFSRNSRETAEAFKKNLQSYPELQYWNNKLLTYDYNKYGHRCKNIDEIDLDNYILFIGCSHTEGVGNYIEDTFPYIVSKSLGLDYYNLGLGASGLDVHFHNLTLWFIKNKPPKYLIYQWTLQPRFTFKINDDTYLPIGPFVTHQPHLEFLSMAKDLQYQATTRDTISMILENLNTKVVAIDVQNNPLCLFFAKIDSAKDLLHFGPKSHKKMSEHILNYIDNKYKIG